MTENNQHIVWLVKEYVASEPIGAFAEADLSAAAQLLARIHNRRIFTDDANHRNFLGLWMAGCCFSTSEAPVHSNMAASYSILISVGIRPSIVAMPMIRQPRTTAI